jgi:YVTN family beta-propeller protein
VLNKSGNSLSILNADTLRTISTVAVGNGPHEVVVSEDGKTAFVSNYGDRNAGSSLSVIDIAAAKERRVDVSPLMRPHGLQVIGGLVYFSAEANNAIARYNPKLDKVDWIMGTGQSGSHMVVGSSDQMRFYTPNIGSDSVTMFELAGPPPARTRVSHISVGQQPEAIHLSPDGKEVWVGLNKDLGIDVIDTATKKVTARIDLGARPYRVMFEPTGRKVYSTIFSTREVVEIDPVEKKVLRRLKLKNRAFGIIFTKDGKYAYVTTIQEDGVVKIDLEKFEVVAEGTAGAGPDGIALT